MCIQHQHHDVCLVNRLKCLYDTGTLDDTLNFGAATQSRGVDEYELTAIPVERNENTVASRTWLLT